MIHRPSIFTATAALAACLATPASAAVPGATETWDGGLAGWSGGVFNTAAHVATGGNPGGHVQLTQNAAVIPLSNLVITQGNTYLGNYDGIGSIAVDLNLLAEASVVNGVPGPTTAALRFRRNSSENGWRYDVGALSPLWQSYTAPLNPEWTDQQAAANGWTQDPTNAPAFADLFDSVGFAEVRLTTGGPGTRVGVDNFALVVPEPASVAVIVLGGLALGGRRRRKGLIRSEA